MIDLFDEAAREAETEMRAQRLTSARTALLREWPMLADAVSRPDFENRLALVAGRIDKVCERLAEGAEFVALRRQVEDSFVADFGILDEERQADLQRQNARRAAARTATRHQAETQFLDADFFLVTIETIEHGREVWDVGWKSSEDAARRTVLNEGVPPSCIKEITSRASRRQAESIRDIVSYDNGAGLLRWMIVNESMDGLQWGMTLVGDDDKPVDPTMGTGIWVNKVDLMNSGAFASRTHAARELVKGEDLTPAQRAQVLEAYIYRWTNENEGVESRFPGGQGPTMDKQSDEDWIKEHAFRFTNDGRLMGSAQPVYLASRRLGIASIMEIKGRDADAKLILAQIGNSELNNVGARDIVDLGDGVMFRIGIGNPPYKAIIKLNASDTYDIEIGYTRNFDWTITYQVSDIYADQLGEILRYGWNQTMSARGSKVAGSECDVCGKPSTVIKTKGGLVRSFCEGHSSVDGWGDAAIVPQGSKGQRRGSVSPDQLNGLVEFDSPFEVTADGEVVTPLSGVYAPSVYQYSDEDGQSVGDPEIDGEGWDFVDGYSGQSGYSGPVMHPSEYLGGGMARDVLAEPGIYAVTEVVDPEDEDPGDPIGWVLVKRTGSRQGSKVAASYPSGRSSYEPGRARVGEPTPQTAPGKFSSEDILAEIKYLIAGNRQWGSNELRTMAYMKLMKILSDRGYTGPAKAAKAAAHAAAPLLRDALKSDEWQVPADLVDALPDEAVVEIWDRLMYEEIPPVYFDSGMGRGHAARYRAHNLVTNWLISRQSTSAKTAAEGQWVACPKCGVEQAPGKLRDHMEQCDGAGGPSKSAKQCCGDCGAWEEGWTAGYRAAEQGGVAASLVRYALQGVAFRTGFDAGYEARLRFVGSGQYGPLGWRIESSIEMSAVESLAKTLLSACGALSVGQRLTCTAVMWPEVVASAPDHVRVGISRLAAEARHIIGTAVCNPSVLVAVPDSSTLLTSIVSSVPNPARTGRGVGAREQTTPTGEVVSRSGGRASTSKSPGYLFEPASSGEIATGVATVAVACKAVRPMSTTSSTSTTAEPPTTPRTSSPSARDVTLGIIAEGSSLISESLRKGAPFAGYESWEDCVAKNSDKGDANAYCGSIKHKVEDKQSHRALRKRAAVCHQCGLPIGPGDPGYDPDWGEVQIHDACLPAAAAERERQQLEHHQKWWDAMDPDFRQGYEEMGLTRDKYRTGQRKWASDTPDHILEDIRDRDPDAGSVQPTEGDRDAFETWIRNTYGDQALDDYRSWGDSEDTPYDPSAEDPSNSGGWGDEDKYEWGSDATASRRQAAKVTCNSCGHTWDSQATSGAGRCPSCSSTDLRRDVGYPKVQRRVIAADQMRNMSPQAWRRLRSQMTEGELRDLAKDLAAVTGGDAEALARALIEYDWESLRQALRRTAVLHIVDREGMPVSGPDPSASGYYVLDENDDLDGGPFDHYEDAQAWLQWGHLSNTYGDWARRSQEGDPGRMNEASRRVAVGPGDRVTLNTTDEFNGQGGTIVSGDIDGPSFIPPGPTGIGGRYPVKLDTNGYVRYYPPEQLTVTSRCAWRATDFGPEHVVRSGMPVRRIAATVHTFDYAEGMYDRTQTDDTIKSGDVFYVPSAGIVGFLYGAWPVAVTEAAGEFHTFEVPLMQVEKDSWVDQAQWERDIAGARQAIELAKDKGLALHHPEDAY